MDKHKTLPPQFFEHLGKLFYAIAASDKSIEVVEIETLKDVIKSLWSSIEHKNLKHIEFMFDELVKENKLESEACFLEFITYKNKNKQLFSDTIKRLIMLTSNAIASSFSGRNKSELIMLAKLDIEFKKKTIE